jgi:hypothetical protein
MRDRFTPDQLSALYTCARNAMPDAALRAFGNLVAGRPAYLAIGGYAVHAPEGEIFDPARPEAHPVVVQVIDRQTLAIWGLQLSRVAQMDTPSAAEQGPVLNAAVLALRLGLLMRCLDTAFLHLENRESFGQKLLHHQLMKARFAIVNAEVQRCLDELSLPRAAQDLPALQAMQRAVTAQFRQAAKLMGGHGFLEGRCHALEFLATLLAASVASDAGGFELAAVGGMS